MISISVHRKTRDLDGATLCQLIARAQDREDKLKRHLQAVPSSEPKPKTTMGDKIAGWFLTIITLVFVVQVIIAWVKR
jgi:hypothetical protein